MGEVRFKILVGLFLAMASSPSLAGTLAQCKAGATAAENQCRAAEAALKASDAARSANTAASSGTDINQNCSNMGRDIGQQQGDVGQAQSQCQAALQKCSSSCQPPSPIPGEDGAIIARRTQCQNTINQELAALGQAMGNLAGNAAQAAACKQNSQGKPPQMPPMQPPQEQPKDEKQAMACDSAEGARYSDCNSVFVAKCTKDLQASNCNEFSDRYCGAARPGKQSDIKLSSTGSSDQKVAGVVVDKSGEGLGSPFCSMVAAYKFCQAGGRGECPSCRGMYNYSSPVCQNDPSKCIPSLTASQLDSAKKNCPADPLFMDPVALKKIEEGAKAPAPEPEGPAVGQKIPERVGNGATATTGGRGIAFNGAGGGGQGVVNAINGATPESIPGGVAANIETGSGGGGGSQGYFGSESTEDDASSGSGDFGNRKPIMPAAAVAGMANDVSNQYGPNIFSISTAVYRSMCAQGKLTHCKRK